MLASLFTDLASWDSIFSGPLWILVGGFQLWMFIDALRRREWLWAVFIWLFPLVNAMLYFVFVFRASPSATRGFELPGAHDRRRIKELQGQIYHLDKAHHHSQLGDIYFQQGKLDKAEECYRAALERDGEDLDTRAHLGQCLLRRKLAAEARPLLEGVVAENPKHDYGYTLMALAETMMALGDSDRAIQIWKQVTENNTYPRAKVQLAELYIAKGQPELARAELNDVIADDAHAPPFQRKRDRVWVSRARKVQKRLG